jgi:hypothetical protein
LHCYFIILKEKLEKIKKEASNTNFYSKNKKSQKMVEQKLSERLTDVYLFDINDFIAFFF